MLLPLGTKVHFMTMVRADGDRVDLRHEAVGCEVAMVALEIFA
jgi:hypothetical protein